MNKPTCSLGSQGTTQLLVLRVRAKSYIYNNSSPIIDLYQMQFNGSGGVIHLW